MEPSSKEQAPSVPINPNPENEAKKESLLNEKYAGLHGSLLLNGEMPGAGKTLDTGKLQDVRKNILDEKSFETTKLTNGSKQERDDYWTKKTECKSFEKQKKSWIDTTKKFLEYYNDKPEMEILGRLGMKAGGENEIYDKYFSIAGEGKGDIGYFATTVSTKLERDEIEKYNDLIGKIGGFYGENSSTVAKNLTEAVTNVKVNYSDFEKAAAEQFNQGESMEGIDILKGVHERSGKWDGIQKQKQEAAKKAAEEKIKKEKEELERKENEKKELGDLDVGEKSIPSEDHSGRNEDAILSLKEKEVFGVFDGVGGNAAGDVASKLARASVEKYINEYKGELTEGGVKDAINKALTEANKAVFDKAKENKNNMASTGVVGYVLKDQDGKMKVVIGSVGDSRAYIQTKDGILKQITIDDNNVREKFKDEKDARKMQEKLNNIGTQLEFDTLQKDERELFEGRRNITQAIGHEEIVTPNIYAQDFQEGDRLVFLTDGISDNLTDKEINKIISESKNSQEATDKLTEAASKRSKEAGVRSKKDDMSALVVGISELPKGEPNTSKSSSSPTTSETPKGSVAQKTEETKKPLVEPNKDISQQSTVTTGEKVEPVEGKNSEELKKIKQFQEEEKLRWESTATPQELTVKITKLEGRKAEVEKLIEDFKDKDYQGNYQQERKDLEEEIKRLKYKLENFPPEQV